MKNKVLLFALCVVIVVITTGAIILLSGPDGSVDQSSLDERAKGVSTQDGSMLEPEEPLLESIAIDLAKEMIITNHDNSDFIILDIRTPEEYAEGHIDGAQNLDFYNEFEQSLLFLDKEKRYLIYCRSGNRSGEALELFQKHNFTEVYDLEGGYLEWQK